MNNYKTPLALASTIRRNAPTSTLSGNFGRSGGYYGDEVTYLFKKRFLFVEIGENSVIWHFRDYKPVFF